MSQQFIKDPDAKLDYVVDWSAWLGADTISASQWIVATGITKDTDSNTQATATIWLSGGTHKQNYEVTNRVTTAQGRINDRTLTILCYQQ